MAEQISAHGDFDLYPDRVLQPSTIDVDVVEGSIGKLHLTNYPSGLPAGTHTFVGLNLIDGSVLLTRIATITFTLLRYWRLRRSSWRGSMVARLETEHPDQGPGYLHRDVGK